MQRSLTQLSELVDGLDKASPDQWLPLQKQLRTQLARLNERISLVGTILETESSEILDYVKKRRE